MCTAFLLEEISKEHYLVREQADKREQKVLKKCAYSYFAALTDK